jgi:hypothetical protein
VAAVPLFVKRPGPARGEVSDYRAETADILPTVAGVLGIEVPWRTTGVDLYTADLPERTSSTMQSSEGAVTFGVTGDEKLDVARYHGAWFAGGDPYGLAPEGHHDLLGVDIDSLTVAAPVGADATLDQRFPVPAGADVVPALLSGTVSGIPVEERVIAVVFDGRVVAVTRTWVGGAGVEFQARLPPAAIDSGAEPELYLVDGVGDGRTLTPISG